MSPSSTGLPTPEGLGSVSDAPNQLLASTLEHDRGVYEWDGAEAGRAYAVRMVGLLAPFSNADTARFHLVGGLRRDTFLRDPQAAPADEAEGWWQLEQPVEPGPPLD